MTLRIMALMFLEADFMVRKDRVKIRGRESFFLDRLGNFIFCV